MAQTTASVCQAGAAVEASLNGTTWQSLSGTMNSVSSVEQERISDDVFTFDGDTAIVCQGKRNPLEVEFQFVYTETTLETFEYMRPLFEAGTRVYLRWSPKGLGAGNFVFTAANGAGQPAGVVISNFLYHEMDSGEGSAILGSFTARIPQLIKTSAASSTGLGS